MSDDSTNKRRVLVATIAVVALIGLGGVTLALLVDEESSSDALTTPGATIDPLTAEGQCRAAALVKFEVTADPKDAPEFTATGAVEKWVAPGENSQSTNVGEDTKLVSISKPGELPRVVLTVQRQDGRWAITQTAGCLDAEPVNRLCPVSSLTVALATYSQPSPRATTTLTAGEFLGNGTLNVGDPSEPSKCRSPQDVNASYPRGPISPVSVFRDPVDPQVVLVPDTQGHQVFTR